MSADKPGCWSCAFFSHELFDTGPCLRRSPLLDERPGRLEQAGDRTARWPWVRRRDWCGDHVVAHEALTPWDPGPRRRS